MHAAEIEALRRDLAAIVGERRVSVRAPERLIYGRDCWPREQLWERGGSVRYQPDVIVWPGSTEDVRRIIRYARARHVPVTPFGAGTSVVGGALPLRAGISLDMKRLSRVSKIDLDARRVSVQTGILGQKLDEALAASGATLGHVPGSLWSSTLGGWIATRSAGQYSSHYGKIEDMVLGLTAVTGAGDIVRTGAGREPGPDLVQLLCGSEGTLAVSTEATLAIHPRPTKRVMRAFALRGLEPSLPLLRELLRAGLRPHVLRLSDPLDAALMGLGEVGAAAMPAPLRAAVAALGTRTLGVSLASPAVLNRAAELLPPRWLLHLSFEGDQETVLESEMSLAKDIVRDRGGLDLGQGSVRRWYERRFSTGYRWPAIFKGGAWADAIEVACTWARVPAVYEAVRRAVWPEALVVARLSHVYPEGACLHFVLLGPALRAEGGEASMDRALNAGLRAALSLGATMSHHHGVGVARARLLAEELGDTGMRLARLLKSTFDPDGILNPGKLTL